MFYNSLGRDRTNIVRIHVNVAGVEVRDPDDKVIASQIDPFFVDNELSSTTFKVCQLTSANTLCLKKVPTFKLSVTLSNLDRFSKFLHCWKAYEISYKTVRQYPSHLRWVRWAASYEVFSKFYTLSNSAKILEIG